MGKHALPLMPAKMRYWELYRDKLSGHGPRIADATFDRLFGDEFKTRLRRAVSQTEGGAPDAARRQRPEHAASQRNSLTADIPLGI